VTDEPAAAIVRTKEEQLVGTHRGDAAINRRLKYASEECHLVSPFPAVGQLPEGFGVQIALVRVDREHDCYPTRDQDRPFGIGKAALDRIGHAIGLTWDVDRSRRLDDASDSQYCHWRAVGHYRTSDGQVATIKGEKEVDARQGSAQIAGKSNKQVAGLREHLMSHAETKARLRAIRSMGIRTAYSAAELEVPFACVRLVFTGHSEDPALRARFAELTAQSFLGASGALYQTGGPPDLPRLSTPPAPVTHSPPPVNAPAVVDVDRFPGDK